uniref:Uncharacterized protein n=1 Tax=Vibrio tasmaniensis TaxID=212663 RepID=A0A0H3ZW19_9VIBR|nr:hypothetical protein [Vibrio tasmaniensis]
MASDDSHFYATPKIEEFSNISSEFQGAFSLKSGCVAM